MGYFKTFKNFKTILGYFKTFKTFKTILDYFKTFKRILRFKLQIKKQNICFPTFMICWGVKIRDLSYKFS